jgi:hypothetical protein
MAISCYPPHFRTLKIESMQCHVPHFILTFHSACIEIPHTICRPVARSLLLKNYLQILQRRRWIFLCAQLAFQRIKLNLQGSLGAEGWSNETSHIPVKMCQIRNILCRITVRARLQ